MNSGYYGDYGYDTGVASGLLGGLAAFGTIISLISVAVSILMLVSMWKVFTKCGKPGWAALIPIYNMYILCEIVEKPWWYILLFLVPIANIYAMFVLYDGVAKKFGKTTGFTIGMMFLPFVFWPMLAFSKDTFVTNVESTESIGVSEPISNLQPQVSNYGTMEQQTINTMEQGYQAPVFNTMVQEPVQPVNNFAQEPVMPINNFAQEPVQPVNNFVQEPVQPVNNFAQEPVQPVNNFAQEPVQPVNNFAQEPVQPVNNFAQEPVMPANNFAQEPVQPVNDFVQEPVMPVNNFAQEPVQPVNDFVQEPVMPVNNFVQEPVMPANNFVQEPTEDNSNEKPTSMWNRNTNNNQM